MAADPALAERIAKGLFAYQNGNLGDAERIFRSALVLAPGDFTALQMIGIIRSRLGDSQEACAFSKGRWRKGLLTPMY